MPDIFQLSADLGNIAKTIASADDKLRLAEAGVALGELAAENRRLAAEVAELRSRLSRRKDLEYRRGAYYVVMGGGEFEGPVCRRCYESEGLINRLKWNGSHELCCTVCKTAYNPEEAGEYEPPSGVTFL